MNIFGDCYFALKNKKTGRYFVEFKNRKISTTFSNAFAMRFTTKFDAHSFLFKYLFNDGYFVVRCNIEELEVTWKN